ncbi:uncharacterized protein [Apostichopus japonicus]
MTESEQNEKESSSPTKISAEGLETFSLVMDTKEPSYGDVSTSDSQPMNANEQNEERSSSQEKDISTIGTKISSSVMHTEDPSNSNALNSDPQPMTVSERNKKGSSSPDKDITVEGPEICSLLMDPEDPSDSSALTSDSQPMTADDMKFAPQILMKETPMKHTEVSSLVLNLETENVLKDASQLLNEKSPLSLEKYMSDIGSEIRSLIMDTEDSLECNASTIDSQLMTQDIPAKGPETCSLVMDNEVSESDASTSESESESSHSDDYVPESDYSEDGESYVIPLPRFTQRSGCVSSSSSRKCSSHNTKQNCEEETDCVSSSSDIINQCSQEKTSCNSASSSRSCGIQVLQTNNGRKRKYDKSAYCPFCQTSQAKLPRHLSEFKEHKDEPEVIQWLATKDPELKAKRLTKMRNYGNFVHNAKVRKENQGVLIPVYRPNFTADPDDYLPCSDCFGYYAKSDLWKHRCPFRKHVGAQNAKPAKRRNYIKEGKMMLPEFGLTKITSEIFSSLRCDEEGVARFIKADTLTRQLAEKLALKLGHDKDQYTYIRTKLREVGRMVVEYRQLTGESNASLTDLIDPKKFVAVVNATRQTSGFDADSHLYETPSLALKIGHSLKKSAEILKGDALMKGDFDLEKRSKAFIELYNMKWEELVSTHALRTLNENKRNEPKYLPVTSDIVKLTKYLKDKVACGVNVLKNESTSKPNDAKHTWKDLAEVTLASLIVFNRKRSGEVAKMTTSDLTKCTKGGNGVAVEGLSKLEQELCKVLWRVEIIGKKTRTVPVLMTNELKEALDLLYQRRREAGVLETNPYIFATLHSEGHIRGPDVIRTHARNCGAIHPEYVTSTSLRKHIATVCQIMNLKDNELDIIARFMGHDIRTHREYYRLPDQTLQVAKVSKVLFNIENGNLQNVVGKSLDEIQIQPDEEVPRDEDVEDDYSTIAVSSTASDYTDSKVKASEGVKKTKQNTTKKPWTTEEKQVVARIFKSCFLKNNLPGKDKIMTAIHAEPTLQSRTWRNIKDFIRNQNRKSDPLSFVTL